MTRDKAVKKAARRRAAETGEPYTRARRAVEAEDQARWWQAYVLAENDGVDELRQRAEAGDDHARRQLVAR